MSSRGDGLALVLKAAAPTLIGALGAILLALPLRFGYGVLPTPVFPLIVVFFWTLYGPSYLPAPSVFAIGLLQDFLSGGPLGLWALVYLVAQFIVLSQRSYFTGREPGVVWAGFAFAAAGVSIIVWLVMSLMSGVMLPLLGLLYQMAATVGCFPLFRRAFAYLHRRVIVES